MPENPSGFSLRVLLILTLAGVWVCVSAPAARCQTSDWEIRKAEREMKTSEHEKDDRRKKRDPNEVMAEVNDDLRQLYQLNEAIALHPTTTNPSLASDSIVGNASRD